MPVRVKICGIRSLSDLATAVTAGADAIGFICGVTHVAEDSLTPDQARDLSSRTPPFVARVLVTHLTDPREILELADHVTVESIQVQGPVSREGIAALHAHANGRRISKAVHVTGAEAVSEAIELAGICDAIHLDSRTSERLGGTGITHDWAISREIADALRGQAKPVILAGGLTPENVADAIRTVSPFAVDANSGVENAAGEKDAVRSTAFVSNARDAGGPPHHHASGRTATESPGQRHELRSTRSSGS